MKRVAVLPVVAAVLCSCGGADLSLPDSLFARLPRVVAIEPTDGATVSAGALVAVEFSEPIEPSSVDPSTLAILREEAGATPADLVRAVVEGEARGIDGVYEFAGAGRVALFRPRAPYEAGATYRVIATGGIMSVDMLPLAKNPGRAEDAYVSAFTVERDGASDAGDGPGSSGSTGGAGEAPDASPPGGQSDPGVPRPDALVINEILYDVPGDDTNGVLFVELLGDAGTSVGDYRVVFVNGDNGATTEEIKIPAGALISADGIFLIADAKTGQGGVSFVAGADLIDNFDPQNGPDCVQLLDDSGRLLDALGYGTPITSPTESGLACVEGTPAPKAPSASSLSRTNGIDTDDNTTDFRSSSTPSPGSI